ncbi:MAG: radical SAM protein [Deltaproteobacteria bacterium]|jgi:MiaB/RimO family radical SAM methylthiotransferase|nr:radical SAM protein [Deltaproteobacteria bacterium]
MRVSVVTLGCKVNQADSAELVEIFQAAGFTLGSREFAKVLVLNACALTFAAEREAFSLLRRLRRRNPTAFLIATGCLANLKPTLLVGPALADLALNTADQPRILEFLPPGLLATGGAKGETWVKSGQNEEVSASTIDKAASNNEAKSSTIDKAPSNNVPKTSSKDKAASNSEAKSSTIGKAPSNNDPKTSSKDKAASNNEAKSSTIAKAPSSNDPKTSSNDKAASNNEAKSSTIAKAASNKETKTSTIDKAASNKEAETSSNDQAPSNNAPKTSLNAKDPLKTDPKASAIDKAASNPEPQTSAPVEPFKSGELKVPATLDLDSDAPLTRTRAFLKIQDGCSAGCAYCVVPLAKGPSRSIPAAVAYAKLRSLIAKGIKEVVLTGVHLGHYGRDFGSDLSQFLEVIPDFLPKDGEVRLRLSSLEPREVFLVKKALRAPWLAPHVHAPLQSGSDAVLKRMGRPYTRDDYKRMVDSLVQEFGPIALGTDVLVGFPGETAADFQATYDLIAETPFSYLHVFPFSPRLNSAAATMADQVPAQVKKERVRILMDLGQVKRTQFLATQYHLKHLALVENARDRLGRIRLLTGSYLRAIWAGSDPPSPNTFVLTRLSPPKDGETSPLAFPL